MPPFWTFSGTPYDIVYELNVKSSSLKPNAPKLLKAYRLNSLYCKIFVQFPSNVDVSDTYEHFVSLKASFQIVFLQLLTNKKIYLFFHLKIT